MTPSSLAYRLLLITLAWTVVVLPLAAIFIERRHKANVYRNFEQLHRQELYFIIDHGKDMILYGRDWYGMAKPLPLSDTQTFRYDEPKSGWSWVIKPFQSDFDAPYMSPSLSGYPFKLPSELNVAPSYTEVDEEMMGAQEAEAKVDKSGANPQAQTTRPLLRPVRVMTGRSFAGDSVRIMEQILNPSPDQPDVWYSFAVAAPLWEADSEVANFRGEVMKTFLFVGTALAGLMLLSVRFVLHPLRQIEKGLAGIRSGATQQLEGNLPTEVEPLQKEINALIVSNQEIIERARRQVGNLAHALKTPLAVIMNEASDKSNPLASKVAEQAVVMRDQVNRYLDRARIAAHASAMGRVTEVRPVADSIIRVLRRIHADRALDYRQTYHKSGTETARFQGEQQDLEELLGNLLDNASKWAKSAVELSVTIPEEAPLGRKRLILAVEDDGPGLTEDQRAKGIKRGQRLDESKPGSGLGLTIVSDLVDTYQGRLVLESSRLGGLRVVVELPAA